MALSKVQALVTQFYDWEIRGRGWMVADTPVELEPPFHPFFEHDVPEPYIDDGLRHTWLGTLVSSFKGNSEPRGYQYQSPEYEVFPFVDDSTLVAFRIIFSKLHTIRMENIEQLYTMCSHCEFPLSFELVADDSKISTYLVCRVSDKHYLVSQLKAFFPEASIVEDTDAIENIIDHTKAVRVVDYGLAQEFMRPLATVSRLDHDPYTSLFGILEYMNEGARAVIQVLFSGVGNDWKKSIPSDKVIFYPRERKTTKK